MPVLEGVKKSLKPSGKLLFQMGGTGNAIEIFEVFDTIIKNGVNISPIFSLLMLFTILKSMKGS
ncbi:MAG: hypothetical protein P1P69_06090 [Methanosarcinaceae archaeon]|nr:hypothetical protein [Methanosarcinaceae archaeon]